jgi:hypothetical protein
VCAYKTQSTNHFHHCTSCSFVASGIPICTRSPFSNFKFPAKFLKYLRTRHAVLDHCTIPHPHSHIAHCPSSPHKISNFRPVFKLCAHLKKLAQTSLHCYFHHCEWYSFGCVGNACPHPPFQISRQFFKCVRAFKTEGANHFTLLLRSMQIIFL